MAYQRNSNKKIKAKPSYKRNSRKTDLDRNESEIVEQVIDVVGDQLIEETLWLKELSEMDQFGFEWVHKVAVELLLQCMGKKEILTGIRGKERLIRVFKEKPALDALAMIAKMNGHLFDTIKGTVKATGQIDHNHQHQIELTPDSNRTEQVFNILEQCGALNPPKRLTKDDVEIISA